MENNYILGISAFYHDSAAVLLNSGVIIAAAQEERFSRVKHDSAFPEQAIQYCLQQAAISIEEISAVVYYDKPFLTFDRIFESYLSLAPRGIYSFLSRMPLWLKEKLMMKSGLKRKLARASGVKAKSLPPLLFTEHHQSHAASAFYFSPFQDAVVLCIDGVGEWATTSAWLGHGNQLQPLWQINFPHSLGLLYSAFTFFCGFRVNSGEYKLMGLAPYGNPVYQQLIEDKLVTIKEDGSFNLDMKYFDYIVGDKMITNKFEQIFGGPARHPEAKITQREQNIAASIQAVTEKIVIRLAKTLRKETGEKNLCLAGGVALNCVANGKLAATDIFDNIWIQPAAGDAGGALGAAYAAWYHYYENSRDNKGKDSMSGCYLGPDFTNQQIFEVIKNKQAQFTHHNDDELIQTTSRLINEGMTIGWFQGRMEYGPRALGNRSILADPRKADMQSHLNLKIKFRESFRPFAPSILSTASDNYFELDDQKTLPSSPYMLLVGNLKSEKIEQGISTLPAVTHVDYSARVQTVDDQFNPRFHSLIMAFYEITGCPVVINTSFNIRGEPIVCTPEDAWRCFMHTDMDYLVIGNYLLCKNDQVNYHPQQFKPNKLIMD